MSFLCVDSTGSMRPGDPVEWKNKVTLKKRVYGDAETRRVELKAVLSGGDDPVYDRWVQPGAGRDL